MIFFFRVFLTACVLRASLGLTMVTGESCDSPISVSEGCHIYKRDGAAIDYGYNGTKA